MSKQMKFIVFLFLLAVSEVYSLKLASAVAHESRRVSKSHLLEKPDNPFVKALEEKFNKFGTRLENSKMFNFIAGAALKSFSLLEGNEILELLKCVVTSIEVYYNAMKFPKKTLPELKAMSTGLKDAEVNAKLEEAETTEKDDSGLMEDFKDGQKKSHEVDCAATGEIIADEGGIDYVDDVGTEEPVANTQRFKNGYQLPKIFKKLKEKFKGLKAKFGAVIEKLKEKLKKLEETIKAWLAKPMVKALISFLECALPNILSLILKGGASFASMVTGISVLNIFKQGPKFLKMIIDGIKSIRSGFTKNSIKEKYMEYGKGTASLIMVVVLSAMGS